MRELECVVWCARCRTDKFEVWRVSTVNEQVFEHEMVPHDFPKEAKKFCICGTPLERKQPR